MRLEPKTLWCIVAAYAALVVICLFSMGEPDQVGFYTVGSLLIAWTLAPLVPFCFGKQNIFFKLVGLGLSALVGAAFYITLSFLTQPGPYDLLIFVFVPVYQLPFAAVWLAGIWIWSRFFKERST